jgi:ABC-type lipoprotein export system ATPase subunit
MLSLNRDLGLTFVWVTHALDVACQASRMITMNDGLIGSDVLVEPQTTAQTTAGSLVEKGARQ